jgi:DNA-binding transcriptional LysR family regulator
MQRFDLGHLEVLNALLETQSVSRASALLNVTPSAVSRSLAKIRSSLGDQILVPAGRDLVLTKRGQELKLSLKRSIDELKSLLSAKKSFDPSKMSREFHIRIGDYLGGVLVERLTNSFIKESPLSKLVTYPEGDESAEPLRNGSLDIDIGSWAEDGPELVMQHIFKDRFICVYDAKQIKKNKLSLDDFCREPHLIVSRRGKTKTIVDDILKKQNRSRKIISTLASYYQAFETASRIGCIVIAPELFFESTKSRYKLSACSMPISTPSLQVSQTWHPRHQADPEHKWLREKIKDCFIWSC